MTMRNSKTTARPFPSTASGAGGGGGGGTVNPGTINRIAYYDTVNSVAASANWGFSGNNILPVVDGVGNIGSTTLQISDLYLKSSGKVSWAGGVTYLTSTSTVFDLFVASVSTFRSSATQLLLLPSGINTVAFQAVASYFLVATVFRAAISNDLGYLQFVSGAANLRIYTNGNVRSFFINSSANRTLDHTDDTVFADATGGAIVYAIPNAATYTGGTFTIKKIDASANTVTLTRSGANTIDGATSQVLTLQYESITIRSNGTNWFII